MRRLVDGDAVRHPDVGVDDGGDAEAGELGTLHARRLGVPVGPVHPPATQANVNTQM